MKKIEEKAKAYDEALERAKIIRRFSSDISEVKRMEQIFPELKESEDEQSKKWILEYLYDGLRKSDEQFKGQFKAAIAWLEKQGGKPTSQLKFKVGDFVKDTNHHKQPIYKIVSIDKECYICESDDVTLGDKAVMHFAFDNPYLRLVEQKPADKVEPKFKVGNTIKYVGERKELAADKYTIKEICNDCYITTCGSKIPFRMQEYYTIVNDVKKLKEIEASLPSFDEQQGTPIVNIPFGARDSELQEAYYHIPEGFHAEIQGDKVVIKKGNNSSWSEEDEELFTKTLYFLDAGFNNFKVTEGIAECKSWVQSLKQRCTWKPSEEQIIALRWVLNKIPYNKHKEEISGLLEQIKNI